VVSGSRSTSFTPEEYWYGSSLSLPGGDKREILIRNSSGPAPSDGGSYLLATSGQGVFSCLSSLSNAGSSSAAQGEGFLYVATDGVRYRFDHLASRAERGLLKSANAMGAMSSLNRSEVVIFPTLITDRYGNWVAYDWDASDGWKLNSIRSSDGRRLDLSYVAGTGRVSSVTDGSRTWVYQYTTSGSLVSLSKLLLPDGKAWNFSLASVAVETSPPDGARCVSAGLVTQGPRTGAMEHPSGAVATFTFQQVLHGRSHVPLMCSQGTPEDEGSWTWQSAEFYTESLARKKITGPGLPANGLEWTYAYGPANNCYQPGETWPAFGVRCTTGSPTTKTVSVTAPDGVVSRHTFGNRYLVDEGQLLRIEEGAGGASTVRDTALDYRAPDAGPYPQFVGQSIQPRGDGYLQSRNMPLQSRITTENGMRFVRTVNAFDSLARPVNVTQSSAPSP
jgi:hypothetical protein